ncbi:MAG: chemotaxis protein CheD [Spirochaetaceae bacterium]|nr:chemotaxis protein CheD [Spirochaetaceae bacterium]
MLRRFDRQLQQEVVTIHPGEYYTTDKNEAIATILGSCISVALYDEKLKSGGLNHFMLASTNTDKEDIDGHITRYGMFAMEILINELLKAGSNKKDLKAKVFGGGSVLASAYSGGVNKIPQDNINFALNFLQTERIPVLAKDVGGEWPRKVIFFPATSKILLKRITKQVEEVAKEESKYVQTVQQQKVKQGDVILF